MNINKKEQSKFRPIVSVYYNKKVKFMCKIFYRFCKIINHFSLKTCKILILYLPGFYLKIKTQITQWISNNFNLRLSNNFKYRRFTCIVLDTTMVGRDLGITWSRCPSHQR